MVPELPNQHRSSYWHFFLLDIEMAAVLAAELRDWIDFGAIIDILMLNATVG